MEIVRMRLKLRKGYAGQGDLVMSRIDDDGVMTRIGGMGAVLQKR
jgi:hypothetical protein